MMACSASGDRLFARPSAIARSSSAARRWASAESVWSAAGACAAASATGFARRAGLVAALGDDIDVISLLHHLVLAQLEPAVADELAGPQVVFVAVPRAHEVHLGFREVKPARRLVGQDALF